MGKMSNSAVLMKSSKTIPVNIVATKNDGKRFNTFIPIPKFFYLILGFTPYQTESKLINFIFWLNFLNNCAAVCGQLIYLRNVIEANANFIESTALFGCICFGSDNNVKLMMTIWRKKTILKDIYKEFRILYPTNVKIQQKYKFEKYAFEWKLASRIFYFLMFFTNLFFCVFPIVHSVFNYYTENEFLYRTPLFIWYPFDISQKFWLYCFIYVYQTYCVTVTTLTTLGYALLFSNIILQICIHYDYIATELEETIHDQTVNMHPEKDYVKLRKSLVMHQSVFGLIEQINEAFGFSLFYYISNVTISICCLGIQVAGGASIFILFNYFPLFLFQVIQLFVFCALGEKIIQVSLNITKAGYSGKWIHSHAVYRKSILILMNRAQKSSEIRGGGFFLLSFETFRRVMGFSYQVFALLFKMLKN